MDEFTLPWTDGSRLHHLVQCTLSVTIVGKYLLRCATEPVRYAEGVDIRPASDNVATHWYFGVFPEWNVQVRCFSQRLKWLKLKGICRHTYIALNETSPMTELRDVTCHVIYGST